MKDKNKNYREQFIELRKMLPLCLTKDKHRFGLKLSKLERLNTKDRNFVRTLDSLAAQIGASTQKFHERKNLQPSVKFDNSLPIHNHIDSIKQTLTQSQVLVLAGETGSGKTTQLPKICLDMGLGISGMIGHCQPRRLAARTVAMRIAEELHSELGQYVGYQIRFNAKLTNNTYIKLMTDGILLSEIHTDPYFNRYDTLIIDEAHERSVNIDFLLGYLKHILPKRPDLKLIITSATIDVERFSKHFDDAPIVQVSGRSYPIEIRYYDEDRTENEQYKKELGEKIHDALRQIKYAERGDALVFLSGEREIHEVAHYLNKKIVHPVDILPLFARLSEAEQNKIFTPSKNRKIILATNVAETSITVPGIRYVIDSGYARVSRYSFRQKVQQLPIERISQSSANQRAGRCGRVGEGICIRLYSEEKYLQQNEFTQPEILRTNLASVILKMESLRLGDIDNFPFIDRPDYKFINDGYRLLHELGAIDASNRLTNIGVKLARIPMDPRLGRMLLRAAELNSLNEVLIITSFLSVNDPRIRPNDSKQAADEKHAEFFDRQSDFAMILNLWNRINVWQRTYSKNQTRKLCQQHFLSYLKIRDWSDVYTQIKQQLKEQGMVINKEAASYDAIHCAVLSGLLGHIGLKQESNEYTGARNRTFYIHPQSGVKRKSGKWIMAAHLLETTKLYAITVAEILPQWIEREADHLLKRIYVDPFWEVKTQQVRAFENATLFGLPIVVKRRINYGKINVAESNKIFIRVALTQQNLHSDVEFYQHNCRLIEQIKFEEAKRRRHDLLVSEDRIFELYSDRLPGDIVNNKQLNLWLSKQSNNILNRLKFQRHELIQQEFPDDTKLYPDKLIVDSHALQLSYHFSPGDNLDGITVTIPLPLRHQIPEHCFDWLVPGMLFEKLVQLIKLLPKNMRRNFVPVPEFVKACIQDLELQDRKCKLVECLSEKLRSMTGVEVPLNMWNPNGLPDHLKMNYRLVDLNNEVLLESRNIEDIKAHSRSEGELNQYSDAHVTPIENITEWNFGDLPRSIPMMQEGICFTLFPAIKDEIESVSIQYFDSESLARETMWLGMRRLFLLYCHQQFKYIRKSVGELDESCVLAASFIERSQMQNDIESALADELFVQHALTKDIRQQSEFLDQVKKAQIKLIDFATQLGQLLISVLNTRISIIQTLDTKLQEDAYRATRTDIQTQLEYLFNQNFVSYTGFTLLQNYPRYLNAIQVRINKAIQSPITDQQRSKHLLYFWTVFVEQNPLTQTPEPYWRDFYIMLEEYRVSLFAQELKTAIKISPKRLHSSLKKLTNIKSNNKSSA